MPLFVSVRERGGAQIQINVANITLIARHPRRSVRWSLLAADKSSSSKLPMRC
jgi:hypothetical protein